VLFSSGVLTPLSLAYRNTDASTKGRSCFLDPVSTGGLWTAMEAEHHINYLKLPAIFLALKVFVKKIMGKHA